MTDNTGKRQHRTMPFIIGSIAILSSAIVATIGLTTTAGPATPPVTTDPRANQPGDPWKEPAADAGDGGNVTIDDVGFSPLQDSSGSEMVTWGALLTNTSGVMAAQVTMRIEVFDENGEVLSGDRDYAVNPTIPPIAPGETTGVGQEFYLDGAGLAEVVVSLETIDWWPSESMHQVAPVSVGDIEWTREGDNVHFSFTVESSHGGILFDATAIAIFRDPDGKLIGASSPDNFAGWATIPPGWSHQQLTTNYGPPEGTDEDRTEIYVHAGDHWE